MYDIFFEIAEQKVPEITALYKVSIKRLTIYEL